MTYFYLKKNQNVYTFIDARKNNIHKLNLSARFQLVKNAYLIVFNIYNNKFFKFFQIICSFNYAS